MGCLGISPASIEAPHWRFRDGKEDWKAATSGLYPARPPEGPLHGSEAFSGSMEGTRR